MSNDEAPRGSVSPGKALIFKMIALVLALVVIELGGWAAFRVMPQREKLRAVLAGEVRPEPVFQRAIGQAYLLYTPSPGYRNAHGPQHNEHGYRGPAVPLRRTPGVARVLCLGGSTTYGWAVERADQTYPAHLQRLLAQRGFGGVEVINGGLPWGTTAELLTHYQFKWHYYRPDLVIINTGGNDGQAFVMPHYQPDYSHWRQSLRQPEPLSSDLARALLHSRSVSLVVIPLFFDDRARAGGFVRAGPPNVAWYPAAGQPSSGHSRPAVPQEDVAFRHNLEALVDAIVSDGARVLLVPFREAPQNGYDAVLRQSFLENERILADVAAQRALTVAPFPVTVVEEASWQDDCHLDSDGSLGKARHIADYAAGLLADLPRPERVASRQAPQQRENR